jgi:hypothetical protein
MIRTAIRRMAGVVFVDRPPVGAVVLPDAGISQRPLDGGLEEEDEGDDKEEADRGPRGGAAADARGKAAASEPQVRGDADARMRLARYGYVETPGGPLCGNCRFSRTPDAERGPCDHPEIRAVVDNVNGCCNAWEPAPGVDARIFGRREGGRAAKGWENYP